MTIQEWLLHNIKPIVNPTIIELGTYDGVDSEWLLDNMTNPYLVCVEPHPISIPKIHKRLGQRVKLLEVAVGASNGITDFYLSEPVDSANAQHDMSSSIRKPTGHLQVWPHIAFRKQCRVPMLTLDTIATMSNISHVDFIWADIQGAEGDMIDGGRETLSKTKYLYTECATTLAWYEGQLLLPELLAKLPNFSVMLQWKYDVLLMNKEYK